MARVTLASQAIIIAQLEAQVAELTTTKGILMSEVESLKQELVDFGDDSDKLYDARQVIKIQAERIKLLGMKVAAQPKSAPRMTVTAALVVESAPAIEITDADRRIWSAFKALPREKRQSYYKFAHATVGHLGIHNIVAVREAYLAQQAA